MTVTEKAAYLRGLASGLNLDESKPETKLINAMMDVIDDLALSVADLEDELALVTEQLDAVDEDLDSLEEFVYDDECDCDCDDCYDDDEMYEVECPACHETVEFDEDSRVIKEGKLKAIYFKGSFGGFDMHLVQK